MDLIYLILFIVQIVSPWNQRSTTMYALVNLSQCVRIGARPGRRENGATLPYPVPYTRHNASSTGKVENQLSMCNATYQCLRSVINDCHMP